MHKQLLDFLEMCVISKCNILVCGSNIQKNLECLKKLTSFLSDNERIVYIGDENNSFAEPKKHSILLPSASDQIQTYQELIRYSTRLRPDRVIVDCLKNGCIRDWIQVASTGHEGSMSSLSISDINHIHEEILLGIEDHHAYAFYQTYAHQLTENIDVLVDVEQNEFVVYVNQGEWIPILIQTETNCSIFKKMDVNTNAYWFQKILEKEKGLYTLFSIFDINEFPNLKRLRLKLLFHMI